MKRLNLNKIVLTALLLTAIFFRAHSQCMVVPVSLDYRVNKASTIVEGMVTGERATWDNGKKRIYTIYTIDVTAVFKGSVTPTIEVATWGGTVGDITMTSTNNVKAAKGSSGIFLLYASKANVTARGTLYECFSDVQGFLKYDRSERSAKGVFDKYASVENNLYPLLESKTGRARQVRKAFPWTGSPENNTETQRGAAGTVVTGNNDLAHSLTSFSPTTTTAGTGSVLTIYGSGFGSSQGSSYVQFRDADDNSDYMNATSYSSWSDTEIQVKVPSGAGTGKVKVIVDGTSKTSSGTLTINYNLDNSSGVFAKMKDDDGYGGYTFTMRSDFASSSGGSVFRTAVQQWICNAGVNWKINSTNTSIDEVAFDGVNVVRWDNKGELTGGTLGVTNSYYNSCNETVEIDMTFDTEETDWWEINFNNGLVWYYNTSGNCPSGKYDFYSVALHELGHACRQGHVIKSGDMMHYTIGDGEDNEDFVQEIEIAGGQDAVSRSSNYRCSTGMTAMSCSAPSVTLSTGTSSFSSESGSTTVKATLSSAYYTDVTVQLALSGTATQNTDYTLGATTLTIYAGQTSASTTLSCTSDVLDEDDETVIIDISSVTNGTESGTQQKTVTIVDNDAMPTITLSTPQTSVTEGTGTYFDFTATLSAVSGRTVVVYFTHGGTATWNSDYIIFTPIITNMIVIAPGELSSTTSFIYFNDTQYESSETVIIGIDSIENGTANGTQQFTVTINDNDAKPTVTLSTASTGFSESGTNSTQITATLSAASGMATTVNLGYSGTATFNTDYTVPASITIPAGSTSASITITATNDSRDENDETIIVDITSVTNATESGTQQKTMTLYDDDAAPTVTIAWSKTSIGEAITGNSNAVVTLSAVSDKTVTVTLAFSNTATLNVDYTITGSSITIPAGSTSGYVTMNNIPDTIYEGNEYITVDIATVTNATEVGYQNATMTINDDDAPPTGRSASAVVSAPVTRPAEAALRITAGPNPFSTQLTVRNLVAGSVLQLVDMNGVIMNTVKVNNSTMTINTASLKTGIYFLKINGNENSRTETIKLLKQ